MKRIGMVFGTTLLGASALCLMIGVLYGLEPNVLVYHDNPVHISSYEEYLDGSLERYGDTPWNRVLTTIAYPGAVVGGMIHNQRVERLS